MRVLRVKLQELPQVSVLFILGANALFLEYAEEVLRFDKGHRELLRLGLDVLFKHGFLKELLSCLVGLQEFNHEHDHYLN